MARERWLIDSWEVTQGLVRDVESRSGLYASAAMVGDNVSVPNRRGQLWRPKVYGPGGFILNGWLGGSSRSEWEMYWDDLLRAIAHPERLLTFTRYLANGTIRVALGEVAASVAPAALGDLGARFGLEVRVPDGVWRSFAPVSFSNGSTIVSGAQIAMPVFAGNTAPNDELTYTLTGPAVNPTVAAADGTASFSYAGTVAAGATLIVNSETWSVTGTANPTPAALTWKGYRYMTVPVSPPGVSPAIIVTAAGLTAASKIDVTGEVLYLT